MTESADNLIGSSPADDRWKELFRPEAVKTLQEYVAHLQEYAMIEEAHEAVRDLTDLLALSPQASTQYPEAFQVMQALLVQCRAICFPLLEEDDVVELFATHVGLVIDTHQGELWNMVRALMVREYDYKKRDALKERMLATLVHSQERITNKGPLQGEKESAPTVENWIINYVATVGTGQADALKRSAWLTRSPSIVRLAEQEKVRVRLVMMLRDKLPLSSTTLEGLEEVVSENKQGRPVWLREGRIEEMPESQYAEYKSDVRAAMKARDETYREAREKAARELLLEKYDKWRQEPVISEAMRLDQELQATGEKEDAEALLAQLFSAINAKSAPPALVSLWALARTGQIHQAFTASVRYRMYWGRHMDNALRKQEGEFTKDPGSLVFVLPFFRHALAVRLGMESETAKIAIMAASKEAQRAGEGEFSHMVYGDLETGIFEWGDETPYRETG